MRHDTVAAGAFVGEHIEAADWDSHPLYAWPAFSTTHRLVRLDRSSPAAIRSPFGGLGFVAVEIAMDELAYELHMDPLDLRRKSQCRYRSVRWPAVLVQETARVL
jgi:xanthine dehydrogenase YagR molybdenum-binding subunit